MGNYHNLEKEFVDRTIKLIDQYYADLDKFPFEEQFNYTLTINCLLGLIVMPKERVVRYIPNHRLTRDLREEVGLFESELGEQIRSLRDLVKELRHAVAHFDIEFISDDPQQHYIDWVKFHNTQKDNRLVAKFRATELLPFLRYYANCLLENLEKHR